MLRWIGLLSLIVFLNNTLKAYQVDTSFSIAIYNDFYYQNDFNQSANPQQRLPFLFNHNQTKSFAINQALISFTYKKKKVRAHIGLQAGSYADATYGADSSYKYIYEASAGLNFSSNSNWWMDVGILPSYLGSESAISSQNLTLSRSLSAENSPYYLMGIYTTYRPHPNWMVRGIINNGWQKIIKSTNTGFGYGIQIQFHRDKLLFNYGNYYGNEGKPLTDRLNRFFNNFYIQYKGEKGTLNVGLDYGNQQTVLNGMQTLIHWYNATFIKQFHLHEKWNIVGRLEYYRDVYDLYIKNFSTGETIGASINLDFKPTKSVLLRIEPKTLFASRNKLHRAGTEYHPVPSILVSCAVAIQ